MTKIVFMPASAAGQSHRTRQEGGKMVAEADDPAILVVVVRMMVGPAALVAPSGGVGQHGDVARGAIHAFRRHPDGLGGGSRGALLRPRLALAPAVAAPGLASGLCLGLGLRHLGVDRLDMLLWDRLRLGARAPGLRPPGATGGRRTTAAATAPRVVVDQRLGGDALDLGGRDILADQRDDGGDEPAVLRRRQGEGAALEAGAAGAADAVDIVLGMDGNVEIEDVRQAL